VDLKNALFFFVSCQITKQFRPFLPIAFQGVKLLSVFKIVAKLTIDNPANRRYVNATTMLHTSKKTCNLSNLKETLNAIFVIKYPIAIPKLCTGFVGKNGFQINKNYYLNNIKKYCLNNFKKYCPNNFKNNVLTIKKRIIHNHLKEYISFTNKLTDTHF
jgi:hypothetical protein